MSKQEDQYRFYIGGYPDDPGTDILGLTFNKENFDGLVNKLESIRADIERGCRVTIFMSGVGKKVEDFGLINDLIQSSDNYIGTVWK